MIQLEALIAFTFLILIINALLQFELAQMNSIQESRDWMKAKVTAEECSFLLDSFYNNVFSGTVSKKINCFEKNSNLFAREKNQEAGSELINSQEIVDWSNNTIKVSTHYN